MRLSQKVVSLSLSKVINLIVILRPARGGINYDNQIDF